MKHNNESRRGLNVDFAYGDGVDDWNNMFVKLQYLNHGDVDHKEQLARCQYILRAECMADIIEVEYGVIKFFTIIPLISSDYPDVVALLESDLSLEELKEKLRFVEDGHVMVETVALRENYTGIRTYEE